MDFGRRLGASDEHIPKWICKERATTPPPKRHAALRVALKLAWGFVAQSVEYRRGYTPSFAPRPRPISAQRMYSYFGDTTLVLGLRNMGSRRIYYFDNNATTRVAPEVVEAMVP